MQIPKQYIYKTSIGDRLLWHLQIYFFNESILKKYMFSKYIYKKSLKKASSSISPYELCLTMDK